MSRVIVRLSPKDFDQRGQTHKLDLKDWRLATEVVGRRGFSPNSFAGLDRLSTRLFAQALGQALEQEAVPVGAHDVLSRLHTFMTGPGIGGFVIARTRAW